MLIDVSYFTAGIRHIENASVAEMPSQNSLAVNGLIEGYINQYQEEFIQEACGNKASLVMDSLNNDENTSLLPLINKLKEPFADYVYFHILRDANAQTTITGLVELKSANKYISPIRRQVIVWNEMVKKMRLLASEFVELNISYNLLTPINTFNL